MKAKKIPYYFLLSLLTMGASLIIGFLSFGGMFALWPILPLAFGSLILSVAYEGEIYLQNIKNALNKIFFKREYLKHHLANEFLLKHFPTKNLKDKEECPQFFRDYKAQLKQLHAFGHKALDEESQAQKDKVQKTLRDMEKWFAAELFAENQDTDTPEELTKYQTELREWLKKNEQKEAIELLDFRRKSYIGVGVFSVIAGLFMGFGTTYLLVGVFEVIPALSFIPFTLLPIAVIPMAVIAGMAYGLLTFNAITDMINNDTLRKWYYKLTNAFKKEMTPAEWAKNIFMATAALVLLALAITLTICTAGTWWTVVQNARPLFEWMGKIPGFVMGIINPIITGISTLIFDVENTSETLDMIDEALDPEENIFQSGIKKIVDGFQDLRARENWWQIFNPARIFLVLTIAPLRIILFLGHLVSIGVTADRVPGISEVISAILGIISECFQDMHYFVDHDHEHCHAHKHGHDHTKDMLDERLGSKHGHNHDVDLPTRVLKALFSPIYFLAAAWATCFSKLNGQTEEDTREALSLDDAWKQQMGQKKEVSVTLDPLSNQTSNEWKVEQAVYRIERHKQKQLDSATADPEVAAAKAAKLTALQNNLRADSKILTLKDQILNETTDPVYNRHRFYDNGKTKTQQFLEQLPERIGVAPAA